MKVTMEAGIKANPIEKMKVAIRPSTTESKFLICLVYLKGALVT